MTVRELIEATGWEVLVEPGNPQQMVSGGFAGDLLSWVMGKAPADGVWLTIMSNVNVAAVAALTDVACVILTESVTPDEPLLRKAQLQGINLLGSSLSTYQCAAALSRLS